MTPITLKPAEMAAYLQVSRSTVDEMRRDGRIPAASIIRVTDHTWRVDLNRYRELVMGEVPTPLRQPATAADVRQIVRDELAAIFRLDRSA